MEAAKTLIRTCVRSFHDTRQILIVDALLIHSVLDASDLGVLLSAHPKDVRKYINPLKTARLVSSVTRVEMKVGASSNRGQNHEWYYINFHHAIDAIKYRIMRLKKQVEQMYQQDISKKDWRCPHCKAEYEELEVLDSVGEEGFLCHRCGHLLEQTEDAGQPAGNHEKIRLLNTQLSKFENIILRLDSVEVPENDFVSAELRKKPVPRPEGSGQFVREYIAVGNRRGELIRGPDQVSASALNVNLTNDLEQEQEDEVKKEERRAELARQNQLPVWHTSSAISAMGADILAGEGQTNGNIMKKEEDEEKKPIEPADTGLQAYLEEMKRERVERLKREALEDIESADGDEDEDFEDVTVPPSGAGTPVSSQQQQRLKVESGLRQVNGIKREYNDSDSASDANTPAAVGTPASGSENERNGKRVKFDHGAMGGTNGTVKVEGPSDEEDDEADFEDAM